MPLDWGDEGGSPTFVETFPCRRCLERAVSRAPSRALTGPNDNSAIRPAAGARRPPVPVGKVPGVGLRI